MCPQQSPAFVGKHRQEPVRPVVHNQLIREFGLCQKGIEALVVGYLERDMRIAAENRRDLILLAQTQYLQIVVTSRSLMALRSKRVIVHLEQRMRLLGSQYQRLEVELA